MEIETKRFRPGEATDRPLGGRVSPDPFPQALYNLAKSRGYESQLSLGKTLGFKRNNPVGNWYRGSSVPSVNRFSSLVVLLYGDDQLYDHMVDEYGQLLAEGIGRKMNSEGVIAAGRVSRKPKETPYHNWLENFVEQEKTTFAEVSRKSGLAGNIIRRPQVLSLENYSMILQRFPDKLNLTIEQTDSLAEAVAMTIEQAFDAGRRFGDYLHGRALIKAQQQMVCKTYNGAQVATELGISRQGVKQLRDKLGLPLLLTDEHLEILRNRNTNRGKKKGFLF